MPLRFSARPDKARPKAAQENPHSLKASHRIIPELDGLRALSIALVVISHGGMQNIVPGGLGVLIFFVISGFLISRLMIAEIEVRGTLAIGNFYLRRILRLMPTLLAFLAMFVPATLMLGGIITWINLASAIFYFSNYYAIFAGYTPYNPLSILWSLAVEEHFYILFPFIVWAFRKKLPSLLPWLCGMAILVLLWRIRLEMMCRSGSLAICGLPDSDRIFHGTDTIVDCILYGAIAAFAMQFHPERFRRVLINRFAFAAALFMLLLTLLIRNEEFRQTVRYSLQAGAIAVVIANILFGNLSSLRRFFARPALVLLGQWSYALYLVHFGVMELIELPQGEYRIHGLRDLAIYFSASLAITAIFFLLIEKPMKKVRRRFGSNAGKSPAISSQNPIADIAS